MGTLKRSVFRRKVLFHEQEFGVAHNAGQNVVQVMGDPACKKADCLHLSCPFEFFLALNQSPVQFCHLGLGLQFFLKISDLFQGLHFLDCLSGQDGETPCKGDMFI